MSANEGQSAAVESKAAMDAEHANAVGKLIVATDDNSSGVVEICGPRTTLSDVRSLIMDFFDDELIPDQGNFCFCVNGIPLSVKEETSKNAWDLISSRSKVSIHSKRKISKADGQVVAAEEIKAHPMAEEKQEDVVPMDIDLDYSVSTMHEVTDHASSSNAKDDSEAPVSQGEHSDASVVEKDNEGIESSKRLLNLNGYVPYDRNKEERNTIGQSKEANETEAADEQQHVQTTAPSVNSGLAMDNSTDTSEPSTTAPKESGSECHEDAPTGTTRGETLTENGHASTNAKRIDDCIMLLDDDDTEEDIVLMASGNDAHQIHNQVLKSSRAVLNEIKSLLNDNPIFCSEDRRNKWMAEISGSLAKSAPNVVIGVLGNTGVGKSSLLNALLEEASVLPTSGSRGCTAAVVELKFNNDLKHATEAVSVYMGEVEFITLQEWAEELKVLIAECSNVEEKTIYAGRPEEEPDVAAAWSKIDQVYGHGTMDRHKTQPSQIVYDRLINDNRVKTLLTPPQGSSKPNNTIIVEEGQADPEQAKILLQGFGKIGARLRRTKKKWAQAFRSKINDYVYQKGNGDLPQTWPLIRKVTLKGPWVALNTGACLVDLPGVRDANAARAKVSENYLQHCNKIWVVAPIKRAVDDGTAKELLGEQFKRRLLMDGQYGNVAFICTQTDDCEATEIMRDHQDVAMLKPGRWERMTALRDEIMKIEQRVADLQQKEEDLKIDLEEANLAAKDAEEELSDENKETEEDDSDKEVDVELLEELQTAADSKQEAANQALLLLKTWQEDHKETLDRMEDNARKLQRRLKTICATVRNDYSTSCLQADFLAGLKDLCRKPDEEEANEAEKATSTHTPLPDDFNMDVYCISANDYLKIEGIKPSSDGPPSTFTKASDTQIPSLRALALD